MNILGTCRHLIQYLSMSPAQSGEPQAEAGVDDSDGPGAGGGYDDSVEIDNPSDGPGAGGGYDDLGDSDGPGAGGGYDSLSDSDGPGAGGGYDTFSEGPAPGDSKDKPFVDSSARYMGEEWFLGSGPKKAAANSNKTPVKGKAE
jgi:hypothetical protein